MVEQLLEMELRLGINLMLIKANLPVGINPRMQKVAGIKAPV